MELFFDRQRPMVAPHPAMEPTPIYDRLLAEWQAGTGHRPPFLRPHDVTVRGTGQGLGGPPAGRLPVRARHISTTHPL